ncbi:MAG: hypothetical protein CMD02_05885 [Flavobacteriales bacterium]|nr:hypothetical protein [Flavobacteriales bacterium]
MNNSFNNIIFLLGFPTLLISQSVTDSVTLEEVELFESKELKHSIGIRYDLLERTSSNFSYSNSFDKLLEENTTIYVKSYGALNTPSFRGTSASHTLISWNGIPINSSASGLTDLKLLPSNGFNNLGISYGGNSTIFGSGSVGGTIHLNNIPFFTKKTNSNFTIERGSYGLSTNSLSVEKSSDNYYYYINYSHLRDSNNFKYNYNNEVRENIHSFTEGQTLISNFSYLLNTKSVFQFNYWNTNLFREVPGNITVPNSTAEQTDKSERYLFTLLNNFKEFKFKVNHALLFDNLYYIDVPKQINSFYEGITNISEFNLDYNHKKIFTNFNLSSLKNDLKNSSYENLKQSDLTNSVYTSISYQSKIITNEFSLRKEFNKSINHPFIPSYSCELKLKNYRLRGRINKNFRSPTFNDRFWISSGSTGNMSLLPETGINMEIGLDFNSKIMRYNFTYFNLNVDNWILWNQQDNGIWMPENIRKVSSKGFESKINFNINIHSLKIQNEFNYQYNLSINKIGIDNLDASVGNQLIYTPINKANFNSNFTFNDYNFIFNQSFIGKVYTSSDNLNFLNSHYTVNLTLIKKLNILNSDLILKINNLFNLDYQTYLNYPQPGRNFVIQINILT